MKTYLYNELGYSEPLEITEEQILDTYYPFWSGELRKLGREDLISEKNCIEDWVVVNWAWENNPPGIYTIRRLKYERSN